MLPELSIWQPHLLWLTWWRILYSIDLFFYSVWDRSDRNCLSKVYYCYKAVDGSLTLDPSIHLAMTKFPGSFVEWVNKLVPQLLLAFAVFLYCLVVWSFFRWEYDSEISSFIFALIDLFWGVLLPRLMIFQGSWPITYSSFAIIV